MMNLEEIKRILPHRYPMLLIDRVLELDPGSSCKAIKNVTANEQVFQGHFPQMAVMPGVMIVEAMAQVGGIVIHSVTPEDIVKQSLVFFAGRSGPDHDVFLAGRPGLDLDLLFFAFE